MYLCTFESISLYAMFSTKLLQHMRTSFAAHQLQSTLPSCLSWSKYRPLLTSSQKTIMTSQGSTVPVNQPAVLTGSLQAAKEQLRNAIRAGAIMIWYVVGVDVFSYSIRGDREWREELRRVREYVRDGTIASVYSGEAVSIDGIALYPIEIEYENSADVMCVDYDLLTGSGEFTKKIPYFLRSESKREDTLRYITS